MHGLRDERVRRQRLSENLLIRLRQRPVDPNDLPLATFETQHVRCTPVEARSGGGDRLLAARLSDASLFPRLDLVRDYGKGAAEFLELPLPDDTGRLPVPPLTRIDSDDQHARVL